GESVIIFHEVWYNIKSLKGQKQMRKKSTETDGKQGRGRPRIDPGSKRAYRFVMRMNSDLADVLNLLSDESGLSRSVFVERILISFVNQDPRIRLNHVGRKVDTASTGAAPPGSLASFGAQWRRWQALRHDVIGEDVPSAYGAAQPSFDDY